MTREEAIKVLEMFLHKQCDLKRTEFAYDQNTVWEAVNMASKALETVEEFEKAQIIMGGRLNGRTYAYKCGLEDGKRKALEQEPCKDAISREAVLDIVRFENKWLFDARSTNVDTDIAFNGIISKVSDLPPVQSKVKTGHWILTDDDFVYCSECEDSYYPRPIDADWYYCPHCGAKMEVNKE